MLSAIQLIRRGESRAGPIFTGFISHFSTASNSERLAGKVAVITGAASGIGEATAKEFIRNGAKVILADIRDDLGRAVAADLGPDATYTRCDVTDESDIAAAVDLAVARHGCLDIVYSNTGITGSLVPTPLGSLDLADFDRVMAVNARAMVACLKHAARVMVPRRSGSILCTASVASVLGSIAPPAYSISKAAVVGMVRSVAGQLARDGVRVNAISPHGIPTPLAMRGISEMYPAARAAVYLASDEAKYISGHNLVVDGGFTVGKGLNIQVP